MNWTVAVQPGLENLWFLFSKEWGWCPPSTAKNVIIRSNSFYLFYNEHLKKNKKIKKEELENWLKSGWIKGRKINFNKE